MTGIRVTWNFVGSSTLSQRKSSLIKTDENFIKLTNILRMKPKEVVRNSLADINNEYNRKSTCGRVSECFSQKLEDLQSKLNISRVSSKLLVFTK